MAFREVTVIGMATGFERAHVQSTLLVLALLGAGCVVARDDAAPSAGGAGNTAGAGGETAGSGTGGSAGSPSDAAGIGGASASGGATAGAGVGGAGTMAGGGGAGTGGGGAGAGGATGQAGASGAGGAPTGDAARGAAVYSATCGRTMCHGPGRLGPDLATRVPVYDDARLASTIRNGVRGLGSSPGMPPQTQLTDQDIADVIAYLRATYPAAP